jgi:hypothetical protein
MSASDKMIDRQQDTAGQFWAGWNTNEDLPSIKRLMLAVLQDALQCLASGATHAGGLETPRCAQEAADWFADINEREVFSFNSVCAVLGLDPAPLRRALIEWPTSGLRMSRRTPVAREPGKLSVAPYRKRTPNLRMCRSMIDRRAKSD